MPRLSPLAQCEADIAATEKHLQALRAARNYLAAQAGSSLRRQATTDASDSADDAADASKGWSPAQRQAAAERMRKYWATKRQKTGRK